MKALSIRHPSIAALLAGHRTIEVRAHATQHRGELLLHAGRAFGRAERAELDRLRALGLQLDEPAPDERGALLGICRLTGCRRMTAADWATALLEPRDGEWWAWELADVEAFPEPIPMSGHIFLWDVPDAELDRAVTAAPA